jgi:aminoglycoside/choline kinase family phosphotransferase
MTDIRDRLDQYLASAGLTNRCRAVVSLTGDASDRRYVRVDLTDGTSQILAVYPGAIEVERSPFVNVERLLSEMPVPVPRILGHSDALGIIAQQDLGDVTLQAHLEHASAPERLALYRQAVALVDVLQRRGADLASPRYVPFGLAFDVEKLTFELQFFVTHFLEGHRGAVLSPDDRDALNQEFAAVAGELAAEPRVLCHRDYHCRNLMVRDGTLYLIDFQDARMGPDTYDLASLLRDSYVDFSDAERDDLVGMFEALRRTRPGAHHRGGAQEFRRRFDLMSVQRNLKALGTFGYQATTRGNPAYVQYAPRTLAHVRTNLGRYPRFKRLRRLLATHLDELR